MVVRENTLNNYSQYGDFEIYPLLFEIFSYKSLNILCK